MNNPGIKFDISAEKKPHFGKSKDDKVTLEWLYEKLIYRACFLFFHIFL